MLKVTAITPDVSDKSYGGHSPANQQTANRKFAADGRVQPQHTLRSAIHCTGVGLHGGNKVSVTLHPAVPDTGIVFRRTDIDGREAEIAARWHNVIDTTMCTVIANEHGDTVGTVEHLMAALSGCRIDNAIIDVHGAEVPIMDGSAEPFVFLIECAGIAEQPVARRGIQVLKEISVGDDEHRVTLTPYPGFSISFQIDFDSPVIAHQEVAFSFVNGEFKDEIARARTFGFLEEVEQLKKMGLVRGGSLDNAVVVNGEEVLNDGGLRFDDEFVRHKVLDGIGDMYLAGGPIIGHFHGLRSGHRLNHRALTALFADDDAWCYTTVDRHTGAPAADAIYTAETLAALA